MKYILLCALLISGAFFSMSGHTQQQPALQCEPGETPLPGVGGCGSPAADQACKLVSLRNKTSDWGFGNIQYFDSLSQLTAHFASYNRSYTPPNCGGNVTRTGPVNTVHTHNLSVSCPTDGTLVKDFTYNIESRTNQVTSVFNAGPPASCTIQDAPPQITNKAAVITATFELTDEFVCPDNHPIGPINYDDGTLIGKYCYRVPDPEPCDCSELAGEGTLPYTSFIAKKGVYSSANPPQCNTVTDPDTGGQCHCQLVAQKWLQTTHTNNGVEYDRWSPLPYDKDKPSGTYTGVACGDEDADTVPPDKEECFTLKSGVKWCFANPDEKCTVVNGQEQCSTGCGYVNGDFVCYEDKDPIIPDRPNEDMEEIDDTITDPDKTMPDINKADLKQIQRGTEQRLDNVIIGVNNNNNQLQNIGDKIGQTNSKLDGIGEQLDGQGKSLKGIADGIEDAFGDEGSPDGKCEGECTGSWYESAYPDGIVGIWEEHKQAFDQTPAFQFLNQFKVTPSGSQPDWSLCFNLGPMGDFGCDSIAVPDFVWNFIKICILITAAFLCRALIFGG